MFHVSQSCTQMGVGLPPRFVEDNDPYMNSEELFVLIQSWLVKWP